MDNGVVLVEPEVESMEIEHEPGTVEFTSFTNFVDENCVKKLRKVWRKVELALEKHGLSATLDEAERSITVSTTTETKDPRIIHKARGCIVLASQFRFSVTLAYKGVDDNMYYDYIQTGYQDGGLAAIHGMDKEQYILKRERLFKHLKVIAVMCLCGVKINEDCMVVAGKTHGRVKKYRSIVERCILEDLDPTKLQGFEKCRMMRMLRLMKI